MDELIIPKKDIEPVVLASVIIPEMEEALDKDEERKMDPEELDQMNEGQIIEDMDAVVPRSAPATDIAYIAVVLVAEMTARPDGFCDSRGKGAYNCSGGS